MNNTQQNKQHRIVFILPLLAMFLLGCTTARKNSYSDPYVFLKSHRPSSNWYYINKHYQQELHDDDGVIQSALLEIEYVTASKFSVPKEDNIDESPRLDYHIPYDDVAYLTIWAIGRAQITLVHDLFAGKDYYYFKIDKEAAEHVIALAEEELSRSNIVEESTSFSIEESSTDASI